jgi:hypothetical protein
MERKEPSAENRKTTDTNKKDRQKKSAETSKETDSPKKNYSFPAPFPVLPELSAKTPKKKIPQMLGIPSTSCCTYPSGSNNPTKRKKNHEGKNAGLGEIPVGKSLGKISQITY